jgi:hypothetical protein
MTTFVPLNHLHFNSEMQVSTIYTQNKKKSRRYKDVIQSSINIEWLIHHVHDQIMKRRDNDKQLSAQKNKDKKQGPD